MIPWDKIEEKYAKHTGELSSAHLLTIPSSKLTARHKVYTNFLWGVPAPSQAVLSLTGRFFVPYFIAYFGKVTINSEPLFGPLTTFILPE